MILTSLLGVIRWSNAITLGSVIVGVVLGLITLSSFVILVRRKGRIDGLEQDLERARRVAEDWQEERNVAVVKADRFTQELADEKIRCAKEIAEMLEDQREQRHALKNELEAAKLELAAEKKKPDQTVVVEGLTQILERLTTAEQTGVSTVGRLLESMEERAARRDAAIVDTQQQIVAQLSRVAEVVADRVGEVVQQKVEQLQEEAP